MLSDIALLVLRLVIGLLIAGHGAQKLFGWFGGPGVRGFAAGLGKAGLVPAFFWSMAGGLSEFGGGVLFSLGLLSPIGALGISASMLTAIITVHWQKGFWNTKGGIEFPLANLAAAVAVALIGPGALSLDAIFRIALPEPISLIGGYALVVLGVIVIVVTEKRRPGQTNQPKAA